MPNKVIVVLAALATLVAAGFYFTFQNNTLEAKLDKRVQPIVTDLAKAGWDLDTFYRYASPSLQNWFEKNNNKVGMPSLKKLGAVADYKGIQKVLDKDNIVKVSALVTFETGDAQVALQLSKHNDEWLLDGLNVNSPVLTR